MPVLSQVVNTHQTFVNEWLEESVSVTVIKKKTMLIGHSEPKGGTYIYILINIESKYPRKFFAPNNFIFGISIWDKHVLVLRFPSCF